MLQLLTVKNFALIRELQLQPDKGLNVITGETGAGKSILLGALGLVLGNRAESSALLNKDVKCVVEAVFDVRKLNLHAFFETHELDYSDQTILRREIAPGGKSRSFINDTPVSLQLLRELGDQLIAVHTQHTGLLIANPAEQLSIIDDFSGHQEMTRKFSEQWKKYQAIKQELSSLIQRAEAARKEKDYLQFQFDELEKLSPKPGEEQQLEQELNLLNHASEIAEAGSGISYRMAESENSIQDQIRVLRGELKSLSGLHPVAADALQRLDAISEELKDIAQNLRVMAENTENDPERLNQLNERIALMQQLLRKHGVPDATHLVELMAGISEKLMLSDQADERMQQLQKQVDEAHQKCLTLAEKMHELRVKAAASLCKEAEKLLATLEMPAARLLAELEYDPGILNATGASRLRLKFTANAGQAPQLLDKVASGGEVSRLNLCFKSLLAGKKSMPTLIFDEADTGVSGEVAGKMGALLQRLGEQHQVIAISHLPQVAAAGNTHFFVYKQEQGGKTETHIRPLEGDDRVQQIARMLSGKQPGETAVAHARELLNH